MMHEQSAFGWSNTQVEDLPESPLYMSKGLTRTPPSSSITIIRPSNTAAPPWLPVSSPRIDQVNIYTDHYSHYVCGDLCQVDQNDDNGH